MLGLIVNPSQPMSEEKTSAAAAYLLSDDMSVVYRGGGQCDLLLQHALQEQMCKSKTCSRNKLRASLVMSSIVIKGHYLFYL